MRQPGMLPCDFMSVPGDRYVPSISTRVSFMPRTVRSSRFGFGEPWNCPLQRSMLSSTAPPWLGPK